VATPLSVARRGLSVQITAHGSGAATASTHGKRARPGERKGFVEEMRIVAMKLHTKDQAPKEGEQKAAEKPFPKWEPTREGYLKFLAESKALFQTLENIVEAAPHPDYRRFQNTGIERAAALEQDIRWFQDTYNLEPPAVTEDGPGEEYSRLVQRLAEEDPPAFLCHFYNIYFAHSAGGRMIGKKVSEMCLDGAQLQFYQYNGDLKELLEKVRDNLNDVAETWTDEQKEHCLQETTESFKYSGAILRSIAS
jgi:heme oxygenase